MSEEQYRKLKRQAEEAKQEASRAQGALDSLMAQLKDDYGCRTLKEARTKLEELEEKKDKATKDYEKALFHYQSEWNSEEGDDED